MLSHHGRKIAPALALLAILVVITFVWWRILGGAETWQHLITSAGIQDCPQSQADASIASMTAETRHAVLLRGHARLRSERLGQGPLEDGRVPSSFAAQCRFSSRAVAGTWKPGEPTLRSRPNSMV